MPINPYLTGDTRYEVIAPAVVARSATGKETYIYRGGTLPRDTVYIDHLLKQGMIRPIGEEATL